MISQKICDGVCPDGSPIRKDLQCGGQEFCHYPEHRRCCYECRLLKVKCSIRNFLDDDKYFKFLMLYTPV